MKPIIFCIVGESGSGKTMLAEALEEFAGIPMIQSYTDRKRRTPDENGHTFLEPSDFDLLKQEDMIASTNWNGARYCCLKSDVKPVNTYVIDCHGLETLRSKFSEVYDIYAIRIHRGLCDRIKSVGMDRVSRDADKFYLSDSHFDFVINNCFDYKISLISLAWHFVGKILDERECLSWNKDETCCGTQVDSK